MRPCGIYAPTHPWLGALGDRLSFPVIKALCATQRFYDAESRYARERARGMQSCLHRGAPVYLLGIGPGGHNSGAALIEVTTERGVRLLFNNEEERFAGIKHCTAFPALSIEALLGAMAGLDIKPAQIHACLASWDYIGLSAFLIRTILEEAPHSLAFLDPASFPPLNVRHIVRSCKAAPRLGRQLGLPGPLPIVGLRHHANHAYFSYAVSPFAGSEAPVIITVLDGTGDAGAISLYVAQGQKLRLIRSNQSVFDSLGLFYSMISSTQGGWTILSSEGRYMGAAAWGDGDRLTNPFYRPLRELFYFHADGNIYLNRSLANWPRKLQRDPYTSALTEILGPPIPLTEMWNPDAVLRAEDVQHAGITRERLDKAAATQLVFEDLLLHIVGYLIRRTRSSKLVLTGGTALNGVGNMRLLEAFDEDYYERSLGMKNTRLHLWVPPTPGDAGAPMGAAYHFALANGCSCQERLQHAFYCGSAPSSSEVRAALDAEAQIGYVQVGNVAERGWRALVADVIAYVVARDGILGLFQGAAETGPRALGHRSILANPCNPHSLEILNSLVKFREVIRPLAPMATREAALRWFELSAGASDDDYNAYNYMVLTARARPEAYTAIPAVIHRDGTGRVQIVRGETDPFTYAYLKAMGQRAGVEVSVNTSLNVGGPIVQTPAQALQTLKRSKGMDGLLMIGADGSAFLAWHDLVAPPKDGGRRLRRWLATWQEEVGVTLSAGMARF